MLCSLHICLIVFLSQFSGDRQVRSYHITGYAKGTTYAVTYYSTDSVVSQLHIDNVLASIDSSLSIYKPYSHISKFNASPLGSEIDTFFRAVVKKAMEVSKATGGAFDITIYPLVNAWGFGVKKLSSIPDSLVVRSLLPCTGAGKIQLKKSYLSKSDPCVSIDVNGIAQGYSVDVLADLLEKNGIH